MAVHQSICGKDPQGHNVQHEEVGHEARSETVLAHALVCKEQDDRRTAHCHASVEKTAREPYRDPCQLLVPYPDSSTRDQDDGERKYKDTYQDLEKGGRHQ